MSSYFWSLFTGENSKIDEEKVGDETAPPPYIEPEKEDLPDYALLTRQLSVRSVELPESELDKVFIKFDIEEGQELSTLQIIKTYLDLRGKSGLTFEVFKKYYDNLVQPEKSSRKRDKIKKSLTFSKSKKKVAVSSEIQNLMTLDEMIPTEKVKEHLPTIPAEWYFKVSNINGNDIMDLEEFFLFNMMFSNLKFDWFSLEGKSFHSKDWVKFFWSRYLKALEDFTLKLIVLRIKYGTKILNQEQLMDPELKITATDLIKYYDNFVSGVDVDYDPYDGDIKSRIFSSRMLICMDPNFTGLHYTGSDQVLPELVKSKTTDPV